MVAAKVNTIGSGPRGITVCAVSYLPAIAHGDPFPHGPYSVGLTQTLAGGGDPNNPLRVTDRGPPYTIQAGDGRAIAGHIDSRASAYAIAAALNLVYPWPPR